MAKGDDAIRKKKNKLNRKKMQNDPSTVSARVAAIIAAKQRRKSGKRRNCEGMCYSLPTPEDPFNDGQRNKGFGAKKAKKLASPQVDGGMFLNEKGGAHMKEFPSRNPEKVEQKEPKKKKVADWKNEQTKILVEPGKRKVQLLRKGGVLHAQQGGPHGNSDCPSKFLIVCLNAIQNALLNDGTFNDDMGKPLLVSSWGVEFWKSCSVGSDILETTGPSSTIEQIAWMVSTAADTIARKEKEGLSITSPFLLFIVPSQEKATKVRSVCKPLKALGIHTVSLHPGALLDHQIHGLKSCEPEFLVSTPERLLELVSLKAIDISGVSSLVVDGLENFAKDGFLDKIKSIRQAVSGNPHTVVFSDCFGHASTSMVKDLLMGPICRLSLGDSITSESACIIQRVHVCASAEEKLSRGIQVLDQACGSQLCSPLLKVLFIVGKDSSSQTLLTAVRAKGYSISNDSICEISEVANSERRPMVSVVNKEDIGKRADIGEFEVVIIPDFVPSIDDYIRILTTMARHTVNGVLHSFFSKEDARLAGPLIEILEKCGQTMPEALRNLCDTSSSMLEHSG